MVQFDLDLLPLVVDTRYEFQVFGTVGDPVSYSAGSDIIRWTKEAPTQIIETMSRPKSFTIIFED
jgi:hypothetical protein